MRTVLLACELGGNLGHIGPLSQLSLALQREGWCTPFALKDVVGAKAIITDANRPIYQAPVWPKAAAIAGRPFRISNYADLLALVGFADADGLAAMVGAWDALLALLNPHLIVADFSPTLCLAAHGAIPTALVGKRAMSIRRPTMPSFRRSITIGRRSSPNRDCSRPSMRCNGGAAARRRGPCLRFSAARAAP